MKMRGKLECKVTAFDLIKLTRLENKQNGVLQLLKIMALHYMYNFFLKYENNLRNGNSIAGTFESHRCGIIVIKVTKRGKFNNHTPGFCIQSLFLLD